MSTEKESSADNIKNQMNLNWQYIYDSVKIINDSLKKATTEKEILDANPELNDFKLKFPKCYRSAISGTFSLRAFKEQRNVYDSVYEKKEGNHFDKKNLANVAVSNKIAREHKIYDSKPVSSEDMQRAYATVMQKNDVIKKDNNF